MLCPKEIRWGQSSNLAEILSCESGHVGIGPEVDLYALVANHKFMIDRSIPDVLKITVKCNHFWLESVKVSLLDLSTVSPFSLFKQMEALLRSDFVDNSSLIESTLVSIPDREVQRIHWNFLFEDIRLGLKVSAL